MSTQKEIKQTHTKQVKEQLAEHIQEMNDEAATLLLAVIRYSKGLMSFKDLIRAMNMEGRGKESVDMALPAKWVAAMRDIGGTPPYLLFTVWKYDAEAPIFGRPVNLAGEIMLKLRKHLATE